MKLIVGLGNPGPQYRNTRHNAGFVVLDRLAAQLGVTFDRSKFDGEIATAQRGNQKVVLLKPQTFMNRSGISVAKAGRNLSNGPRDLLVVTDDINLPLGRLRFRPGGSAGGHNGLKSLIEHLGTETFARLRMGVGEGESHGETRDHVLSTFTPKERPIVDQMIERAVEGVLVFLDEGIERAMERFNGTDPSGS